LCAWVFVGVSSGVVGKGVDSGGMAAGSGRMEVIGWREIWRMNMGLNVGCDREGVLVYDSSFHASANELCPNCQLGLGDWGVYEMCECKGNGLVRMRLDNLESKKVGLFSCERDGGGFHYFLKLYGLFMAKAREIFITLSLSTKAGCYHDLLPDDYNARFLS
nr:hypothetical protein [Tanacetum cinerariifolium]